VHLADAVAEDVGESQEDRELDAALHQLVDQLLQVDELLGVLVGWTATQPFLLIEK